MPADPEPAFDIIFAGALQPSQLPSAPFVGEAASKWHSCEPLLVPSAQVHATSSPILHAVPVNAGGALAGDMDEPASTASGAAAIAASVVPSRIGPLKSSG